MAPRLKVFSWSDGFHRWTVATTSRPKALKAWGSEQDLFATGLAAEIKEGPALDDALASPDTVIKTDEAIDPKAFAPARRDPEQAARKRARARAAALREKLEDLDAGLEDRLAPLRLERAGIDKTIQAMEADHEKARAKLLKSLKAAED